MPALSPAVPPDVGNGHGGGIAQVQIGLMKSKWAAVVKTASNTCTADSPGARPLTTGLLKFRRHIGASYRCQKVTLKSFSMFERSKPQFLRPHS